MVGCLDHHRACGVVAGAAGPSGDLVEFAGIEQAGAHAVVLAECGEQDGPDGNVDPHPEGVGAADDLQEARLRELLHEPAVLRQHAGVVHADSVPDQPVERLAEAGGETEVRDELGDFVLLLAAADVDAHQRLGTLNGFGLAEVHHVDRNLPGGQQFLERLVHGGLVVVVVQRDGPLGGADRGGRPAGEFGHAGLEAADVAEGRGHQQELGLRQFQQRNLPCPAALGIGIEVELIHDDRAEFCRGAFAQRDVGEDLRRAADDRGVLVHPRIAGDHPHVLGSEDLAQGKEFFRDQGLDGGGVVATFPAGHCLEMCGDGHE